MNARSTSPAAGALHDRRGIAVTTSEPAAVAALDEAVLGLAAHRAATQAHLEAALAADPGLVPAHCLLGFAARLLGRRDCWPAAAEAAQRARASITERGATAREEQLTRSLEAWCAGDPLGAVAHLEAVLAVEPLDLLAIKLSHGLQFLVGQPGGMRRSLEGVLPAWEGEALEGRGLVRGCYAFALNETGEVGRAERVGSAALEEEPIDPWGVHAVTHALYTVGRVRDGIAWLAVHDGCLAGATNFAGHVHWHRALLLLAVGRAEEVLAIHDERIAVHGSRDYRDLVNSATLLYRLERLGVPVGDRWERLAATAAEHLGDHALGFADVHYVLALVRSGRHELAARFVDSMRQHAAGRPGLEADVLRTVAVPVAQAFLDSPEQPSRAVEALVRLQPEVLRLGGSRAQREIFDLVLADAVARAGSRERASAEPA